MKREVNCHWSSNQRSSSYMFGFSCCRQSSFHLNTEKDHIQLPVFCFVQSTMLTRRGYRQPANNQPPHYSIMAIVSLLIACACLAGAATGYLDDEAKNLQPCPFNLLCRCSRGGPEVGLIHCEDIPMASVPVGINNTKAFALNLRRNGLRRVEEHGFHRTGTILLTSLCSFNLTILKLNQMPVHFFK